MVDVSKRRSLKSLTGIGALPLVPASLILGANSLSASAVVAKTENTTNTEELSIELLLGTEPRMRVTNNSNSLTILRRVHPGVVHAGDKSYDLNHALLSSAYAIGAGRSRIIPISVANGYLAKPVLPESTRAMPLKVAAVTSDNTNGRILNSSRAFFS